jgi:hypothetical protein
LQHDDTKLGIFNRERLKAGREERYISTRLFEALKRSTQTTTYNPSNIGAF